MRNMVLHNGLTPHKVQLVADGHLNNIPVDSVYSGVVTLRLSAPKCKI
jgi:hypothetical protein